MDALFRILKYWKKFDSAAVDLQTSQFARDTISATVNSDEKDRPLLRRMGNHHSNMGIDSPDLVAARIDWVNETKQVLHDQKCKGGGSSFDTLFPYRNRLGTRVGSRSYLHSSRCTFGINGILIKMPISQFG